MTDELACAQCGAPMTRIEGKKVPKFCSGPCRQKGYRKRRAESTVAQAESGVERLVTICEGQRGGSNRNAPVFADSQAEYNAASIKIVDDFSAPIWDWKRAEDWSHEYNAPVEWLKRAIRACREVGSDPEYIRRRYLDEDRIVQMDAEVNDAMWLICKQLSHSVAQ